MLAPVRVSTDGRRPRATPQPLRASVLRALQQTGHGDLQHIDVTESNGRVHLTGTVRSFFAKQTAQITAAAVPGIRRVENHILVQ
jgi:osmotically-inducible protein OsmY